MATATYIKFDAHPRYGAPFGHYAFTLDEPVYGDVYNIVVSTIPEDIDGPKEAVVFPANSTFTDLDLGALIFGSLTVDDLIKMEDFSDPVEVLEEAGYGVFGYEPVKAG